MASKSPTLALETLRAYRQSLPEQAGGGLALAAVLIASANSFFDAFPNANLNTADRRELIAMLGSSEAAREAYTTRASSIHPFVGPRDRYPKLP